MRLHSELETGIPVLLGADGWSSSKGSPSIIIDMRPWPLSFSLGVKIYGKKRRLCYYSIDYH